MTFIVLSPGEWIALIALVVAVITYIVEKRARKGDVNDLHSMMKSFDKTVKSYEKQVNLFRKEISCLAKEEPSNKLAMKEIDLQIEREKKERKRLEEEAKNKREVGRVIRKMLG
jgi:hypothetical protein